MITIHFYLRYHSVYQQTFFITGNIDQLGNGDLAKALPMSYLDDACWYGTIEVNEKQVDAICYRYMLRENGGSETVEFDKDRIVQFVTINTPSLRLIDTWNYPGAIQNAFYTQPFQNILLKDNHSQSSLPTSQHNSAATHTFRVKAPLLQERETLCIIGNDKMLGEWNAEKAILLYKEGNWLTTKLDLSKASFPIAYKYGIWNMAKNCFVRYEDGENRIIHGDAGKEEKTILHDGFAHFSDNTFRGAGVAIPVFSLRSENSFGTGEFDDIKLLADWAKQTGFKLIQLLPINDTTATHEWTDSYPYAAISAFALHPLYIHLESVAGNRYANLLQPFIQKRTALNALPDVDYEQVMCYKLEALNVLYTAMKKEFLQDKTYQQFYDQNKHWLIPYAAFCFLRDDNKTIAFNTWKKFNIYKATEIAELVSPTGKHYDRIAFHYFIQYHLHLQLKDAVKYAHDNGIVMKGDIPIGVYRYSCDAWMHPDLFNMNEQAGAPPDDFAIKGQNWGFPTYNWEKMREDEFAWWKQRFEQMSHYFDAFRIDHILGFFRIWSIPNHAVEGIMGRFIPCIAVHLDEFNQKGIWFDYDRYCKPFINEMIIAEFFGEKAQWIKEIFLESSGWGNYKLRNDFNTQQKIEFWFAKHADTEIWIKEKLFDLISNVLLFEQPDTHGKQFHFRISMENTASFRYLDDHTKRQLKDLYVNYFFHRQNAFWKQRGMQKLPMLKAATNMLICGEDLGMVPDCVPDVMRDLGLLSLEIQRMPKDSKKRFFHPADAPYMSVVTPSTHDMSTIRGWWEENRENTQYFYNHELGQYGEAPVFCEPWINREIIVQHLHSPAMWSIFQLQDLIGVDGSLRRENPVDERINIPANPKHYWRYRMHIYLEDLTKENTLNTALNELIRTSGR